MANKVRRVIALGAALLCASTLPVSCAKKSIQARPQPVPPAPAPHAESTQAPDPSLTTTPAPPPAAKASDFRDLYFAYDQSNLDEVARAALDANAKLLRDHPELQITIEGHCDERGTVEYNLGLGERRASAARDYLTAAGVKATQIHTISFGKERPFCSESNETCWARNRCGHFVLR